MITNDRQGIVIFPMAWQEYGSIFPDVILRRFAESVKGMVLRTIVRSDILTIIDSTPEFLESDVAKTQRIVRANGLSGPCLQQCRQCVAKRQQLRRRERQRTAGFDTGPFTSRV